MVRIYNTLTKEIEDFHPRTKKKVGIYLCGPTVYSSAHLGHGKTAVAFDIVRRWFKYRDYEVRFVSNVTDVGHITTDESDEGRDRINEKASLESLEPMQIADKFFWEYFSDMERLNVLKPDITPRATGHITEQIELVEKLIDRGHAYEVNGSVYFRVRSFPEYGKLSGRNLDDLESGTREEIRVEKEYPQDFALWKFAEPEHIMRWSSPWGEGFPGWHIECSVMALKYLGEGFDIHAGGLDIQFPHHEAEIAQAEAAGYQFARYWMHGNMLTINGEKMSKSKGNFQTLDDFFKKHDPMILRYIFASSSYGSPTEISPEVIESATNSLENLKKTNEQLLNLIDTSIDTNDFKFEEAIDKLKGDFEKAMDENFNTPKAFASMFGMSNLIKSANEKTGRQSLTKAFEVFNTFGCDILGIFHPQNKDISLDTNKVDSNPLMELIIDVRESLKKAKNFTGADEIRDRLEDIGLSLEDTTDGTIWKVKSK